MFARSRIFLRTPPGLFVGGPLSIFDIGKSRQVAKRELERQFDSAPRGFFLIH